MAARRGLGRITAACEAGVTRLTRVEVEAGAALLLTTQASTKVYRTKRDGIAATQSLNATVDDGGLLVLAPDPVVPYESAAYEQRQRFMLSPAASLVAVDWVLRRPEAGAAPAKAVAVDAMRLSGGAGLLGLDLGRVEYDTVVSVLCSGEEAAPVAERLRMLSSALAHRRVGQRPGVLRAALAEEVFRLLHFAMAPLAPRLGASPYGLRIHADVAALMAHLSDATLPTGGFAHSGERAEGGAARPCRGLEAASQLGLLGGGDEAAQWREWEALDTALHAQLSANGPARRAAFGDRGANPNRAPHGATMLGALCALLGLPPQVAAEVIAYTTARDVLSAAADVAEEAAAAAAVAAQRGVANAASSAPLLEAMHPCHDLLDRRIFRT
ncbi:urease accessory protein UreD [Emiliania huxleyi CCMP1516]|uniref:Urease accessory protein UreD n=2 Tax=Emiliania huxleyi TaxID=2903 RepID=A0A0D3K5Z4_EMIH1|nr:hypothetical protein EMIHUDRAFT_248169 [Emiliania huxleyi CCMP1516]XP_005783608.1 urease accessory protein UreD [Emiliania huxleyi CCMP1516]EOD10978.1 hypothetical protein EMIHUDRAFT_248169 [Emiliania huxleyi CCMP1516]EOD31179.1 urease accessory protein UreD [Emiliania huxleyi CCMP1516]|eukprot:XP_005763407.1 hypothetical protein EMIHUDRAFT_248169 [Emiliania huxleyi CCMP1516]